MVPTRMSILSRYSKEMGGLIGAGVIFNTPIRYATRDRPGQRRLWVAIDRGKAAPTLPHRRPPPAGYVELAQTVPLGNQSAARHMSGRSATNPAPPPLPSRTVSTTSSELRRG